MTAPVTGTVAEALDALVAAGSVAGLDTAAVRDEGERLAAVVAGFKQRADQIGEINDAELIAIIDRVDGVSAQEDEVYAAAG